MNRGERKKEKEKKMDGAGKKKRKIGSRGESFGDRESPIRTIS